MTDWMSKIVLFETVDELTDYKEKIENRYAEQACFTKENRVQ